MYVIFEQVIFDQFVIYRGLHLTVCILKHSVRNYERT